MKFRTTIWRRTTILCVGLLFLRAMTSSCIAGLSVDPNADPAMLAAEEASSLQALEAQSAHLREVQSGMDEDVGNILGVLGIVFLLIVLIQAYQAAEDEKEARSKYS